jgi:hypothetical protein
VLEMARAGEIPAHPIGRGKRKTWRFRLSELADAIASKGQENATPRRGITSNEEGALAEMRTRGTMPAGSPRSQWRKSNG